MSTFQGIGTNFYGWKHYKTMPSIATKWFVIFFFPVIPLARYRLRVLTDFENESHVVQGGVLGGMPAQYDDFDIVAQTPLVLTEVLATYFNTYILGPVLLTWPVILIWLIISVFKHFGVTSDWVIFMLMPLLMFSFVNLFLLPLHALRKSRGMQTRFFSFDYRRKSPKKRANRPGRHSDNKTDQNPKPPHGSVRLGV